MVLETHMKLCMTTGFSSKDYFALKIGKMGQKQESFYLLENLVISLFWTLVYKEIS